MPRDTVTFQLLSAILPVACAREKSPVQTLNETLKSMNTESFLHISQFGACSRTNLHIKTMCIFDTAFFRQYTHMHTKIHTYKRIRIFEINYIFKQESIILMLNCRKLRLELVYNLLYPNVPDIKFQNLILKTCKERKWVLELSLENQSRSSTICLSF